MKVSGTALLLCAITLAQAAQPQLTLSGKVCHCDPGQAVGVCSQYGSDNALIVHENCNQFYKCGHGQPIAYFCPGTTLYNPLAETCDWPYNVDCGDRPIVQAPEPEDEGPEDNGGNGNVGGNNNPAQAPAICSAKDSDGVLVAHEHCNWFYKCAHGVPVAMCCDTNLLYNTLTGQCDWAYNVDCAGKPVVEPPPIEDNDGEVDCEEEKDKGDCNCDPAEAPKICAAAGSDGELVAHENCRKFYKCAHGVPVAFSCYGILLYNPYTKQCDWPQNVDCGDRYCYPLGTEPEDNGGSGGGSNDNGGSGSDNGGSGTDNGGSGTDNGGSGTDNGGGNCNCKPEEAPGICAADGSDGVLIAHENCNQFYKCAHGKPVAYNCNSPLLYNPHTQQCDWPHSVDCGDRPIAELDPVKPVDPVEPDSGENGGSGSCNCKPEEAPGICAADGSDGVLIAHENCNQFYKCAHGKPVAHNCNSPLLYNPHTQQCDWPHSVDCGDRPIAELDPVKPVDPVEPDSGENGGSGSCNCKPEEAPGICAADGSDGVLIAHENCNQFYKCAHGKPVAHICNSPLLYNPHTQQCDWAHSVDCGDRPIAELDPVKPVDPVEPDSGENGGSGSCNCKPEEAPGICAADGSDGVLIAHENCNQFYKCAHGKPVAHICNSPLLYNPHTQQCDWPHSVDCGDRPIAELDPVKPVDPVEPDSGENGGSGSCNCKPEEAPGICAADGSDGVLIAHENCNQFYKCAHGKPVAHNCNSPLLYSPHTQQCDWPHSVDCGDRPIAELDPVKPVDPVEPDSGENGGSSTDNGGSETDNGGSGTDNEGGNNDNNNNDNTNEDCSEERNTCNCNPDEAGSICSVSGSDGTFVAHENCNQFYQCAHGHPVEKFCSGNLLYNPLIERCDWPHLVECGDRPIVENEGGNEDEDDNDNGDNDSGDNGTDNGGTCNCNPEEAPAICSASGSDGANVAHQHCNWFYRCAHGVPVPLSCPGNLLYNPYTERCDWPHNVECGTRPIVPVERESVEEEDSDSTESEANCDPSQAPAICAAPGSDGTLVAHENCNQYYICAQGSPVPVKCPGNLLFNPKVNDCDWPYNVDCGDRIVPGSGGGDEPCACDARQAPAICASAGSDGKLIAHEQCNQYFVCAAGGPVARSCPASLLYEPHSEHCLWPAAVSCEGRSLATYASLNKHHQARRGL